MTDDPLNGLNKTERLEFAAIVAPVLRSASEKTKTRRAKFYNQETGEVTGEGTVLEALRGLAKIHNLEHTLEVGCAGYVGFVCSKSTSREHAEAGIHARRQTGIFQVSNDDAWRCKSCAKHFKFQVDPEFKALDISRSKQRISELVNAPVMERVKARRVLERQAREERKKKAQARKEEKETSARQCSGSGFRRKPCLKMSGPHTLSFWEKCSFVFVCHGCRKARREKAA